MRKLMKALRTQMSDLYSGVQVIVDEEMGLDLQQQGTIDPRVYGLKLTANECVLFESDNGDGIAMGRLIAPDKLQCHQKDLSLEYCQP